MYIYIYIYPNIWKSKSHVPNHKPDKQWIING